jgi:hypothetical protein
MRLRTRVVLQLAALCFVLGAYSFAADNAYLTIVHTIPGRDVSDKVNPGFPIDVLINGETCLPRNLSFGNTNGPLSFSPGTYEMLISEANSLAPCTNPPLIDSQVTLSAGVSVTVVAAVSGDQPTLLLLTDDLSPVTAGKARFVLVQAADAPALEATLTQVFVTKPKTFTVTANPGKQQKIGVPAGIYRIQLSVVGSTTVLASEQMALADQSATYAYAAGEAANNSVELVNRMVRGVF